MGPTKAFFVTVLKTLAGSGIPFLVGGGYAMQRHTGLKRPARDLDVFVLPSDAARVLRLFADLGYPVDLTFPHWLGKIYRGRAYVDVIFNSGNGVCAVDSPWFEHSVEDVVLGQKVRLCPPEEMIWIGRACWSGYSPIASCCSAISCCSSSSIHRKPSVCRCGSGMIFLPSS